MSRRQGRDITTTYVSPNGRDITITYVLKTRWIQNYYLCFADNGEIQLRPVSSTRETHSYYASPTRERHNYYLCLADKVEIKLLPMSCRQGGDIPTTYVKTTILYRRIYNTALFLMTLSFSLIL